MINQDKNQRHNLRMARKKAHIDQKISSATKDKGLLLINSGNGKGKSSAAFGVVARALGHGLKVAIVQFIKGRVDTGEELFFQKFPDQVTFFVMGEGFTWETQNHQRDTEIAMKGWNKAASCLSSNEYDLVVLDELNIALKHHYIPLETVIGALEKRPLMQHVIITGRGAKEELIELADTVTEMGNIKHAFKAGIRAQKGIDL